MFLVEISAKNDKFRYPNLIFVKLGVMHVLAWWLVNFLFASFERFSPSITVPELWGEMRSARLFWGRPLCTQIFPGQSHCQSTILGIRKLATLLYPKVNTTSLCVPSFWHDTQVWWTDGRTDEQTDGFAAAYTVQPLGKLALHLSVCLCEMSSFQVFVITLSDTNRRWP